MKDSVDMNSASSQSQSPCSELEESVGGGVSLGGRDLYEGEERDPDYVEDRFRVDRRKLEQLIQESSESENAESFFTKIMRDTNVHIAWPSKLKIGAKSKKDPHIKLSGNRHCVADARSRIMTVLDTKSLRVTLKMDVCHTDHSHVIGKGGNNIRRVMQDTGCHIHFPDSNRRSATEKSSQVSIAGDSYGIEQARLRIRDLLPLVFMFEVPNSATIPSPDPTVIAQQVQARYGVTVSIKQGAFSRSVVVRGSVCNAKLVKEAISVVCEMLTGQAVIPVQVSLLVDIAQQHHPLLFSATNPTLAEITQRTGVRIHLPPSPLPSVAPSIVNQATKRGTVCLSGGLSSVCAARLQLLGCLPLVLMFDAKEDADLRQQSLNELMEQLNVFIGVKAKNRQLAKSVIVKSVERNAANLYEARRRILGLTEFYESTTSRQLDDIEKNRNKEPSRSDRNVSSLNNGIPCAINPTSGISKLENNLASSSVGTVEQKLEQNHNGSNSVILSNVSRPGMAVTPLPSHPQSHFIPALVPPLTSTVVAGGLSPSPMLPPNLIRADGAAWSQLQQQNILQQNFMSHPQLHTAAANHMHNVIPATNQIHQAAAASNQIHQATAASNQINAPTNQIHPTAAATNQIDSSNHGGVAAYVANKSDSNGTFSNPNSSVAFVTASQNLSPNQICAGNITTGQVSTAFMNNLVGFPLVHSTSNQISSYAQLPNQIAASTLMANRNLFAQSYIDSNGTANLLPNHDTEAGFLANHNDRQFNNNIHALQQMQQQTFLDQQLPMYWNLAALGPANSMYDANAAALQQNQAFSLQALMNSLSLNNVPHTTQPEVFNQSPAALHQSPTNGMAEFPHLSSVEYKNLGNADSAILNNSCSSAANSVAREVGSKTAAGLWGGERVVGAANINEYLGGFVPSLEGPLGRRTLSSDLGNIERHNLIDDACDGDVFGSRLLRDERISPHSEESLEGEMEALDHMKSVQSLINDNFENLLSDASYSEMKQKADKAMQETPVGEYRIPTDYWSGFGFSKSMPGSAIREKLALNKLNGYTGPSMTTTYENGDGELEADLWKSPEPSLVMDPCAYHASIDALDTVAIDNTFRELVAKISASSSQLDVLHRVPSEESIASIWSPRSVEDLRVETKGMGVRGEGRGRGQTRAGGGVDVEELLHQLGLSKYIEIFIQQEIDLPTFLTLTDQDLRELGVSTFGARRKILLAISDINERQMSVPPPPGLPNPFHPPLSATNSKRLDIASQSGRW